MWWRGSAGTTTRGCNASASTCFCFSETPLDQIHSMFADISRRQVKLKLYLLAFKDGRPPKGNQSGLVRRHDTRLPVGDLCGPQYDPSWSLERMIAKLVGLSVGDVTPFVPR